MAEIIVVDKNTKVLRYRIGICNHLFREAIPIAQKMPERKLNRSPILRFDCVEPLSDNSNIKPKNATKIEIQCALVRRSENQIMPITVDQTGVR